MILFHMVQLSQNIRASLKLNKLFTLCDSCPSHLNAGNCVWLPYSDHAKTTWNMRKWCSTNTVHMCNTFMNLNVLCSIVSYFSCNQTTCFTLFVQHEGCSYLKLVACRSRWVCSSSNSCIYSYIDTVSLSIHCINLQCVHLAHEMFLFKLQLTLRIHSFSQYTQH